MEHVRALFETELGYVVLLFTLFVVPRMLQRWGIPAALTSLCLGAVAGMGFDLFTHDRTLHLLASFGIVALFLFAGLEVNAADLKRGQRVLWQHLAHRLLLLAVGMTVAIRGFGIEPRAAALISLALFTPSTGFILSSLDRLPLTPDERFWITGKAIGTELLALLLLFVVLQSASLQRLALASLALAAIIAVMPVLFRFFAQAIVPHAPKSEFAFLVMLALVCAFMTRRLGAYYLVGAFVVGIAARRFREQLPALASDQTLHAVEVFSSLFVPFYFFSAGTELHRDEFTLGALLLGLILTAICVPVRILSVVAHRRLTLKEPAEHSLRVAVPMTPTLVFTLVLASILRDQFGLAPEWFGGLIVYTLLNTMVPVLYFRRAEPGDAAVVVPAAAEAG
jgi:Kef-type K+ transport system membrane component KefB